MKAPEIRGFNRAGSSLRPPRFEQTPPGLGSIVFCADFAGPMFEPAEDLNALLIRVLVGDAGSKRLYIVHRHDTSVDKSRIRWVDALFRG